MYTCMCSDTHTQNPLPQKLSVHLRADQISTEVRELSLGRLLKVKVRDIIPTLLAYGHVGSKLTAVDRLLPNKLEPNVAILLFHKSTEHGILQLTRRLK